MASVGELNSLYSELLGRAPDQAGLSGVYKTWNANQVRNDILKSAEYSNRQSTLETQRSQQLTDFANSQQAASQALLDRQNTEQEGLFTDYQNIRNNQEALPALYDRLKNEAGIPGLNQAAQSYKDEIYKTKDMLDHVSDDLVARTSGTLTTESQRRKLETGESEGLQTTLGRLGTGLAPIADMLTSAQSGLGTQMDLNVQQQERDLEPVKLRINAISDKFARELTGFNSDRELQLNALVDKITRERQLSDRDWQLAQTLAEEERQFAQQKSLAATQLSYSSPAPAAAASSSTTYRALPGLPAPAPAPKAAAPAPAPKLTGNAGISGGYYQGPIKSAFSF